MVHIIFSHGKYSYPNSTKISYLSELAQEFGLIVHSIDYTKTTNPEERVSLLKKQLEMMGNPLLILVGSSMGGYVSTAVASEQYIRGLFLMAPAFYLEGYAQQQFQPKTSHIELVHGWQDEIVPYEQSIKFGKKHGARLHLVEDNHRLSHSAVFLKQVFRAFLERVLKEKN